MGTSIPDGWNHSAYQSGFDEHVKTLTPSQQVFPRLLHEWILDRNRKFIIVAGGPGTGKTYTVNSCLDRVKINQLRMAPTARVAQKMGGYTIHSALKLDWRKGSVLDTLHEQLHEEPDPLVCLEKSKILLQEFNCTSSPEIVIIDEIGMVAYWLTYWIIQFFFKRSKPVLVIVMGDPNQLRPVRALHNVFNSNSQLESFEINRIDLLESKRFTPDYEAIVVKLREYVDAQDESGLFTYLIQNFPIVNDITGDILMKCTRALAYLKTTVESYNEFYLKRMLKGQSRIRLWRKTKNHNRTEFVDVKIGCHIFILQNGVSIASNGTALIFERYDPDDDCLECRDPLQNRSVKVVRNNNGDFPIMVGFAATIHKFQGDTIDDEAIVINFNDSRDLNLVYTALSRVKSMNQIIAIQL